MTAKDEEKAKRLAEALRQNLRRRKAQARAADAEESFRRRPEPKNTDGDS